MHAATNASNLDSRHKLSRRFSKCHVKTSQSATRRSAHLRNHDDLLFLNSCKICIINNEHTSAFTEAVPYYVPARPAVKKSNASIGESAKVDDTVQKSVRYTFLTDKSPHSFGGIGHRIELRRKYQNTGAGNRAGRFSILIPAHASPA